MAMTRGTTIARTRITTARTVRIGNSMVQRGGNKCMDPHQTVLVSSVTKKFDLDLPEGCFTELAQDLRRHPHRWHSLNPKRMEKLVAEIFRANHETAEVIHVGKPCDGGVDVVFVECSGTRWLIQVKRREKPEKAEGFSTLQNILGTLVLENERHGMIVSTSDSFSYYAERASGKGRRIRIHYQIHRQRNPASYDR